LPFIEVPWQDLKILSSLNKNFHESEKNSRRSEKILACEQKFSEYEKILSSLNKNFHESEKNSRQTEKNSRIRGLNPMPKMANVGQISSKNSPEGHFWKPI